MKLAPLLLIALAILSPFASASAFDEINTGYLSDDAVAGYDTTAYFQHAAPTEGDSDYSFKWNGATWKFADKASLDLFAANPDKYRPQYGGYCSNQMSLGNLSNIDPGVWLIYDDKLYLFGHDVGRERWENTGVAERIKDADGYWQKYLAKNN